MPAACTAGKALTNACKETWNGKVIAEEREQEDEPGGLTEAGEEAKSAEVEDGGESSVEDAILHRGGDTSRIARGRDRGEEVNHWG